MRTTRFPSIRVVYLSRLCVSLLHTRVLHSYTMLTSRTIPYQLGEHDDASDSDGERGDARGPPGPLPQDHSDLRRMRVAERRRKNQVRNFPLKDAPIGRGRSKDRMRERETERERETHVQHRQTTCPKYGHFSARGLMRTASSSPRCDSKKHPPFTHSGGYGLRAQATQAAVHRAKASSCQGTA